MDLHYYGHRTIQRFIDDGLLPKTGNTLIRLDAHGDRIFPLDMNILTPLRARAARTNMYRDEGTEIWVKEAVDANILEHIIWAKAPWTKHMLEGNRTLENGVTVDVKTLGRSIFEDVDEDFEGFQTIFNKYISKGDPYIIDMAFNFFSADSPHRENHYENADNYFGQLQELFKIEIPETNNEEEIQKCVERRYEQLDELHHLFYYIHEHKTLPPVAEEPSERYKKVAKLREDLLKHYPDDEIKWDYIFEDGNYASDYVLPVHHTKHEDIKRMVEECLGKLLDLLPSPPALIMMGVMYDYDRHTPRKDRKIITKTLEDLFKSRYDIQIEYLEF